MTEQFWKNSQFSIVRHYGQMKLDGHIYVIINKEGKDIFECSAEAEKAGRDKAIEPGEPCDLCRTDFVKYYKKMGRKKFLDTLSHYPYATDKELKQVMRQLINKQQ